MVWLGREGLPSCLLLVGLDGWDSEANHIVSLSCGAMMDICHKRPLVLAEVQLWVSVTLSGLGGVVQHPESVVLPRVSFSGCTTTLLHLRQQGTVAFRVCCYGRNGTLCLIKGATSRKVSLQMQG
jgi:hypothetical protein